MLTPVGKNTILLEGSRTGEIKILIQALLNNFSVCSLLNISLCVHAVIRIWFYFNSSSEEISFEPPIGFTSKPGHLNCECVSFEALLNRLSHHFCRDSWKWQKEFVTSIV